MTRLSFLDLKSQGTRNTYSSHMIAFLGITFPNQVNANNLGLPIQRKRSRHKNRIRKQSGQIFL